MRYMPAACEFFEHLAQTSALSKVARAGHFDENVIKFKRSVFAILLQKKH